MSKQDDRTLKVSVMCFGVSGRRILNNLTHYNSDDTMLPIMVENIKTIPFVFKPLGENKAIIVSRLDDQLLTKTLLLLERDRGERKITATGYFIHPFYGAENLPGNITANRNLRKSYQVLDRVRVVNLPTYARGEPRPHFPMEFRDDNLTVPERQVIWEILRCQVRKTEVRP